MTSRLAGKQTKKVQRGDTHYERIINIPACVFEAVDANAQSKPTEKLTKNTVAPSGGFDEIPYRLKKRKP